MKNAMSASVCRVVILQKKSLLWMTIVPIRRWQSQKVWVPKCFIGLLMVTGGLRRRLEFKRQRVHGSFLIDADERVTPTLRASIRDVVTGVKPKRAYLIQRENHFTSADVKHGCLRPDWVLRLLPREGAHSVGKVHEAVVTPFDEERLEGRIKHFPYASWDSYYRKIELYSRLSADKYLSEGKHCNFVSDILLRPLWAFFKVYVINRGFMDGKLGFIFSMNHCFYTMSKYVRYYYGMRVQKMDLIDRPC